MHLKTNILAGVLALSLGAGMARAVNYAEAGDAGQLLGTAQSTGTATPLTSITGSIAGDGDLFRIYIFDPLNFVAATGNLAASNDPIPGTVSDPQLYLFNAAGFGVMGNDDDGAVLQQSRLLGNVGLAAGYYYLLITGWDLDPASIGGAIFPSGDPAINNSIQGPTGPGGAQPLSGYIGSGASNQGNYQISLVGARGDVDDVPGDIPEPGTFALLGLAFSVAGFLKKKKK